MCIRDGRGDIVDRTAELDQLIQRTLDDDGLTYERTGVGAYLLKLEGIHRLATMCWLVVGDHSLLVEAFFLRRPDENEPALHRWLLARNARMYGVAYSIDSVGDDSPAASDDSADGSADSADPVHNLADPAHNLSEGSGRLEP